MAAPVAPLAAAGQMQQPPPQPLDTPAQAVGNQFISQYYTVQHASPKHLHRFYSDASTLTYGDIRPEGFFSKNATGQKTIHDLVMELGYEDTSTEIYTVDSQYSLGGGVVVQVTGIMQRPGGPKRPFVQTFFLAVQEKGYYVLNDIFRYLPQAQSSSDNGGAAAAPAATPVVAAAVPPAPAAAPAVPLPPAAAAAAATMQQQQLAMQQVSMQAAMQAGKANGLVPVGIPQQLPVAVQYTGYVPPPAAPSPAGTAAPLPPAPQQQPLPMPVSVPPSSAAAAPPPRAGPPPPVPQQQQAQQQPPKPTDAQLAGEPLSYAERLRQGGKSSAPGSPRRQQAPAAALAAEQPATPAPSATPPTPAEDGSGALGVGMGGVAAQQPPLAQAAAPQQQQGGGAAAAAAAADAIPVDDSQPIASVFIRGIPTAVTMVQLVDRLSQYGRLRPNGVILKTQKGRDSFAFIDFEEPAPAQTLLREGLEMEGVQVEVQPKRPTIFRPAPHGGRGGANGEAGRMGPRYDGPGGGRGGFRPGRGGRGPYPGPPPPMMPDGRGAPMAGPPRGPGMPPMAGPGMPGPMPPASPMPVPGRVDGRGFGPDARSYSGGGGRGYGGGGGGRGRGRGPPLPQQQQQGLPVGPPPPMAMAMQQQQPVPPPPNAMA